MKNGLFIGQPKSEAFHLQLYHSWKVAKYNCKIGPPFDHAVGRFLATNHHKTYNDLKGEAEKLKKKSKNFWSYPWSVDLELVATPKWPFQLELRLFSQFQYLFGVLENFPEFKIFFSEVSKFFFRKPRPSLSWILGGFRFEPASICM